MLEIAATGSASCKTSPALRSILRPYDVEVKQINKYNVNIFFILLN